MLYLLLVERLTQIECNPQEMDLHLSLCAIKMQFIEVDYSIAFAAITIRYNLLSRRAAARTERAMKCWNFSRYHPFYSLLMNFQNCSPRGRINFSEREIHGSDSNGRPFRDSAANQEEFFPKRELRTTKRRVVRR